MLAGSPGCSVGQMLAAGTAVRGWGCCTRIMHSCIFFLSFLGGFGGIGMVEVGNPILRDFWLDCKRINPNFLAQRNILKLLEAQTCWRTLGILKYISSWSGLTPPQGCSVFRDKFFGFPILQGIIQDFWLLASSPSKAKFSPMIHPLRSVLFPQKTSLER